MNNSIIIKDGDTFSSNNYGDFQILYENGRKGRMKCYRIRFLKTSSEKTVARTEILKGEVKDDFMPKHSNVGYVGNATRKGNEREYSVWRKMLERCYNTSHKQYKYYGGNGIIVDERWHNFENFLIDIVELDGWDKDKFLNSEIQLDKDKFHIASRNKIYSKNTCCWLTTKENLGLTRVEKIVKGINPSGEIFLRTVREFVDEFGFSEHSVRGCCQGKQKTHKGWKFNYEEVR